MSVMRSLFALILLNLSILSKELITPIPIEVGYDHQKAVLGKKLFFDTTLSKDGTIACVSCHNINGGGDDSLKTSIGINNQSGTINSPTVLNARFNISQFWDGRAKDLKAQAMGPIKNPVEMGDSFLNVINKLSKIKYYKEAFAKIYSDKITKDNIADAIAEYEKTLITPNSRFDKYLKGDKKALNKDETDGYKLFKSYGCISCHNGVNIGGNLYQKIGIYKEFFSNNKIDFGRYNVTKDKDDKYYFKVPTLRNIDLTAPYLHTGTINNLEDVVDIMMKYQLGITKSKKKDIDKIVKFLKTLTGEVKELK